MKVVAFAPYGVHPPRSAGHAAVHAPLLRLARTGHDVDLVTPGLRRFEKRLPKSFVTEIAPRFREHRIVRALDLASRVLGKRARLPFVDLSDKLEHWVGRSLRAKLAAADLVQVDSPWPYAFARAHARGPVVFVAHNVEAELHEGALGAQGLYERGREIEGRAWREADLVLTFGRDDVTRFEAAYGARDGATKPLPIGADTVASAPAGAARRRAARSALEVPAASCVVLFAGSAHGPNLAAADFTRSLAGNLSSHGAWVLVAGSVYPEAFDFNGGRATGTLPALDACYAAADIAVNPMFEGGGMNQKVAEYLARGLPAVSTAFGARGFEAGADHGLLLAEPDDFAACLQRLIANPSLRDKLGSAARQYACDALSWDRITEARLACFEALLAR